MVFELILKGLGGKYFRDKEVIYRVMVFEVGKSLEYLKNILRVVWGEVGWVGKFRLMRVYGKSVRYFKCNGKLLKDFK